MYILQKPWQIPLSLALIIAGCAKSNIQESPKENYILGKVLAETFIVRGEYCLNNNIPVHYFTIISEDNELSRFLTVGGEAFDSDALIRPDNRVKIKILGEGERNSDPYRYSNAYYIKPSQISLLNESIKPQ